MGRPRKPTNLLKISGAFGKNPKREAERLLNEPVPEGGIGDPPREFLRPESEMANCYLELWNETISWYPSDWLTRMDRGAIYSIVKLRYKEQRGVLKGGELSSLLSLYSQMCLTQASRSKGAGKAKPEEDDFEGFVQKKRQTG